MGGGDNTMESVCVSAGQGFCRIFVWITSYLWIWKCTKIHAVTYTQNHTAFLLSVPLICVVVFFRAREQRKARGPESPAKGPAHSPLSLWAIFTRSLLHLLLLFSLFQFPLPPSPFHFPSPSLALFFPLLSLFSLTLISLKREKKLFPDWGQDRCPSWQLRQTDCWAEPRDLALPTALILLHSFTGRPSH